MTLIGYTMMCEQAGPKQLVRDVALAEEGAEPLPTIAIFIEPLERVFSSRKLFQSWTNSRPEPCSN
jgi:hypothetical protein